MATFTDDLVGEPTANRSPSESTEKWYVLVAVSTLWCASYFCILSPGPLMDDMVHTFNLTNTEFASFGTISFGSAMLGSLMAIYLLKCMSLYRTMLSSCICLLIGQSIFALGVSAGSLATMYFGRVLVGVAYGIQNVTVYSVVTLWFEESKWMAFALHTVNNSFEVAVLFSRYCMHSMYVWTEMLYAPYLLGVVLAAVSITACFLMIRIDKEFTHDPVVLDTDLRKVRHFNRMAWMLMIIIVMGYASIETFGSQFTLPLMDEFGVDEDTVNMLISMEPIYALTVAQGFAWVISQYGYLSYYEIVGNFLMTLGMMMAFLYSVFEWQDVNAIAFLTSLLFFYVVGIHFFFAAGFTCLFMTVPVESVGVVNTVNSIGFMLGSMVQSYLFGLIADETGSYSGSLFMCFVLMSIGLMLSVVVHAVDVFEDGPLHKPAGAAQHKAIKDEPDDERYLLNTDDEACEQPQ